jgi:hypothetical protein
MFRPPKSRSVPALVRQLTAQLDHEPYDRAAPALSIGRSYRSHRASAML